MALLMNIKTSSIIDVRKRLLYVFLGGQFGNAFILPVGGFLCAEAGWESIFYVIGP